MRALVVQYTINSTQGVVSCYESRTALRARINYNMYALILILCADIVY